MNEFRRYVILIICIASCAISVLLGAMQMIEDKRDQAGFNEVRWDTPKVPYYRGGSVRRASSSQGSTVTMPRVSSSSQTLFHHKAGGTSVGQGAGTYRNGYAQTGYSSYARTAGHPVRTFSDDAIHSYGGSGSGGGMTGVTSHRKASNNGGNVGYTSSSISISIPRMRSYAYNSVNGTSSETQVRMSMPGRRKAKPEDDGVVEGQWAEDTEIAGKWWRWDDAEEEWMDIYLEGTTRTDDESGIVYRWDGEKWVTNENIEEQFTPVGDMPWVLLLLMVGGYVVVKSVRRKMYEQE